MISALTIKNLKKTLKPLISNRGDVSCAFDADGTLWPNDVGRDFFKYQIENQLLFPKYQNLEQDFWLLCQKKGRAKALLWLAQIQSGISLNTLNQWVTKFLEQNPVRMFDFQEDLINWLKDCNVKIFVVSSSLKWLLDLALKDFIPSSHIIGVETKIKKGFITEEILLPAPVFEEKVPAFFKHSNISPIFVSGNSMADKALLEISIGAKLVVSSARKKDRMYDSERELLNIAKKQKWFFITPS